MPQTADKNFDVFRKVNVAVQYNGRLTDWTTFKLGGMCPALLHCSTPRQLDFVIRHLVKEGQPFILIGGGSNLVVSDQGIPCAVIRYFSEEPIIKREGTELIVAASTKLDDLARYADEHGLFGLNCCSGIPGTVGGAIVGNAGAFGQSVADYLQSVFLISNRGETREVSVDELGFAYRYSNLRERGEIVVSARFKLVAGDRQKLLTERQEILDIRHTKHPDLRTHPCAGSFFRNVEPTSKAGRRQAAGWFLEQAGGKQLRCGGAVIFEKHANIIVKTDGCTSQDVYELSKMMARLVKQVFQLDLEREVKFVGEFPGASPLAREIIW